ncbi:hypothetical protein TNCV_4781501 [Trichonephila clavipes]|nr:hypothetical protein TNCV_4781501 [Trichonephila clavipes]
MPPNNLRVHTENVLVKSVVPFLNCRGGDRWCRHLSSLREFLQAKSYCYLYGARGIGQRQAYICHHENFVGLGLTASDMRH